MEFLAAPWDYAFFMDNALHQDLGWFWNYWLLTTESVDGGIQDVKTSGRRTAVTVRQNGQMPTPVILKVEFAPTGNAIKPMSNSQMVDPNTAIVTFPVDVWFNGSRTFVANLDFGGRAITRISLDPAGRFPDRDVTDNIWPRAPQGAAFCSCARRIRAAQEVWPTSGPTGKPTASISLRQAAWAEPAIQGA